MSCDTQCLRGERAVAWAQTDMGVCVLTRSAFRRLRFRFMGPEIISPGVLPWERSSPACREQAKWGWKKR